MILILTTEEGDFSHPRFIDWLENLEANYLIISGEQISRGDVNFSIDDENIYYNEINLTKEVKCVFYRRWFSSTKKTFTINKSFDNQVMKSLYSEMYEIRDFLFENLANAIWYPSPKSVSVNKIEILKEAMNNELNVPKFLITNSKKRLIDFYTENDYSIITKAIGNLRIITFDEDTINPIYTKQVSGVLIDELSNNFFPSFFQRIIIKKIELRVLFFNDRFFTSAILSQENEMTMIDSRLYDEEVESRLVPYELKEEVKLKLIKMLKNLNINIGCIDIIIDEKGEYYFLEINPVGQISGYSERCFLNFEREFIENLIKIDNGEIINC